MLKAGQGKRPAYSVYQIFWHSLDWLFPPACGGCNQPGARWCMNCRRDVHLYPTHVCGRCGSPFAHHQNPSLCSSCRTRPPVFQALRAWAVFEGPVRNAIHRLKYRRDQALGEILSLPLIESVCSYSWPIDLVTAVPLSRERMFERGYNQSNLLALPIALALGYPFRPEAIFRVRNTPSQVGLSGEERRKNVAGAFQASPGLVKNRNVLIIDDVTTTGATIQSCAEALIEAGAQNTFGLTLARVADFPVE